MRPSEKKVVYFALALIASFAFVVLVVRASYETNFLAIGPSAAPSSSIKIDPVSNTVQAEAEPATPTGVAGSPVPLLTIPSIGVNAPIDPVGIAPNGDMDTSPRLADVGWYEYGTKIGDVGSAVIDGHVDNSLALPAVFYKLRDVKVGDDIYVTDTDGTKLHFVVTNVADYSLTDAPVNQIFHDTSGQRLINLITCEGTWDSGTYAFDHRIVVTAALVPAPASSQTAS